MPAAHEAAAHVRLDDDGGRKLRGRLPPRQPVARVPLQRGGGCDTTRRPAGERLAQSRLHHKRCRPLPPECAPAAVHARCCLDLCG